MLFLVLSFVAGITLVQQLAQLPENAWVVVAVVCIVILFKFKQWRLMFFVTGFVWAVIFANMRLSERLADELESKVIEVEGTITGLPQYDDRRVRFDFLPLKSSQRLPEKIRLNWYFPRQMIKSGQHWRFNVKLKKPHGRFNQNGFDYEQWLFVHNIGATGYVRALPKPVKIIDHSLWKGIGSLRQDISDQLALLLKGSDFVGVIKALTVGDRSSITDEQWQLYRTTGIVHLLAISGLHIGFIAGVVYFLSYRTASYFLITSPQRISAIAAIMIAFFYAALAGFSLPTQRALLMLAVVMLAVIWQRNVTVTHVLSIAMLVVLMIDPLAVLSAGFWLSFFAVGVIAYSLGGRLEKGSSWVNAIKIHVVTALGLSPLLLFYFQQVSVISPIANFIAVPIVSVLVVPLCFMAVITMGIFPLVASSILSVIDFILQGLWFVLTQMTRIPYAMISTVKPPIYLLPFAVLGVMLLLSPKGVPARWVGIILLLPIFLHAPKNLNHGEVLITVLDVGQGLAMVVETKNHTLLFDTGAKYSETYNMGSAVIVPFLNSKGITDIDVLMISHGDNDHIGGATSVIEQYQVKTVITSVTDQLEPFNAKMCQSGQSWYWDSVGFEILSPEQGVLTGDNNNSCVLKITAAQKGVLLTGDIEMAAEKWLIDHKASQLKSDILIAPHHGSKTSSSVGFLAVVKPSIVLISSGYKNRFSFPHEQVLTKYQGIGAEWINTATAGAIVVKLMASLLVVKGLRFKQGKYWN